MNDEWKDPKRQQWRLQLRLRLRLDSRHAHASHTLFASGSATLAQFTRSNARRLAARLSLLSGRLIASQTVALADPRCKECWNFAGSSSASAASNAPRCHAGRVVF